MAIRAGDSGAVDGALYDSGQLDFSLTHRDFVSNSERSRSGKQSRGLVPVFRSVVFRVAVVQRPFRGGDEEQDGEVDSGGVFFVASELRRLIDAFQI